MTSMFGTLFRLFFRYSANWNWQFCNIDTKFLTPLNTLVLGALVFGWFWKKTGLGVLIGLLGSLLLVFNGAMNHPNQNYYYAILVIIASICYAVNVNLIKKVLSDLSPVSITTGNFLVLLFPSLAILYFTGFLKCTGWKVQHAVVFIMILGIVGTGIANIVFQAYTDVFTCFATSVTYLIPVVAFWDCWIMKCWLRCSL
jgi:hypothetical protein